VTGRSEKPSAAVVVPAPRAVLGPDEVVSVRHLRRHLGAHDIYLVAPEGVEPAVAELPVQRFHPRFFRSRFTFSALLMHPRFYEAFRRYDYVLLHHLDSLVLSDELNAWCRAGYDYVGAPWTRRAPDGGIVLAGAGNGGFSLRRVSSCLAALAVTRRPLNRARTRARHLRALGKRVAVRRVLAPPFLHEDKFWSYEVPRLCPWFRVAPAETALRFAFETEPRFCFERNGGRLPFGCHDWTRYDRAFWEPYLLDESASGDRT